MISEPFASAFAKVHELGEILLRSYGRTPETLETALRVEAHRWYWKPARTRLFLIAESPVYTTTAQSALEIDFSGLNSHFVGLAQLPPRFYGGLIYCLAYGERSLLPSWPDGCRNAGTPQFWKLFQRLCGARPCDSKGERIGWKITILRELQRRGIWLLDASAHAIYYPGGQRLGLQEKAELHYQWWHGYGNALVQSEAAAKVWVIGKTVYDCLTEFQGWVWEDRWIYQPNARNVDREHNWAALLQDVQNVTS